MFSGRWEAEIAMYIVVWNKEAYAEHGNIFKFIEHGV